MQGLGPASLVSGLPAGPPPVRRARAPSRLCGVWYIKCSPQRPGRLRHLAHQTLTRSAQVACALYPNQPYVLFRALRQYDFDLYLRENSTRPVHELGRLPTCCAPHSNPARQHRQHSRTSKAACICFIPRPIPYARTYTQNVHRRYTRKPTVVRQMCLIMSLLLNSPSGITTNQSICLNLMFYDLC